MYQVFGYMGELPFSGPYPEYLFADAVLLTPDDLIRLGRLPPFSYHVSEYATVDHLLDSKAQKPFINLASLQSTLVDDDRTLAIQAGIGSNQVKVFEGFLITDAKGCVTFYSGSSQFDYLGQFDLVMDGRLILRSYCDPDPLNGISKNRRLKEAFWAVLTPAQRQLYNMQKSYYP